MNRSPSSLSALPGAWDLPRGAVLAGALCATIGAVGCGQMEPVRLPTYQVRGEVLVDGLPAEGALVYFHAADPVDELRSIPMALVQVDGSFQTTTYVAGDGLPRGSYAVTVLWPLRVVNDLGEVMLGDDRLRARYGNAQTPAAMLEVTAGENPPLRLELTGAVP